MLIALITMEKVLQALDRYAQATRKRWTDTLKGVLLQERTSRSETSFGEGTCSSDIEIN